MAKTNIILQEGFMSNQELADFFGITKKTYCNFVQSYLEKLATCADFERVRGGVLIKKVIFEQYEKNTEAKKIDDKYFNEEIKRCIKEQGGFASVAGIAKKAQLEEDYKDLTLRQVEKRMSDAGKRNYGAFGDTDGGTMGVRDREWAIKLDGMNAYRPLTTEEREIFLEITSIFYTKAPEKILEKRKLEQRLRNGEIDKDKYFELVDLYELDMFPSILGAFMQKTGYQIVLASKYEIIENWKQIKKEKAIK